MLKNTKDRASPGESYPSGYEIGLQLQEEVKCVIDEIWKGFIVKPGRGLRFSGESID